MSKTRYADIEVKIVNESNQAYQVFDGDITVWLAKSQIISDDNDELEIGETYEISIPEWLALKELLI